jgi:hypothetical protein
MSVRKLTCVTKDSRLLAAVSAAQLAFGLCGVAVAVRRRRAFDLPFWQGQEATVGGDSLLMGTALSAPLIMLGAQAWATVAAISVVGPTSRILGLRRDFIVASVCRAVQRVSTLIGVGYATQH